MTGLWGNSKKFADDNGMSLALLGLFLVSLGGQCVAGWLAYNDSLLAGHFPPLTLAAYLRTGNFLDGVLSNWQAALLQLAVLVRLGAVLRQKGAPHSRKPSSASGRDVNHRHRSGSVTDDWLHANSLSLALLAMFVATFLLHLLFGEWQYNENQALRHLPAISLGSYVSSSSFWFSVFQCWEAEFAALCIYVILSIFLRQEGSPESKPVGASNAQTGGANE